MPFPETVGAQLRLGQKLYLESAVAPGLKVEASVDHIRPQVGAMSRALVVIADVDQPRALAAAGDRRGHGRRRAAAQRSGRAACIRGATAGG